MTTYHHLDWNTLNSVKNHLYRRLASPINNALGRLAIARHVEKSPETEAQLIYVERNLERAMNLIRAWAALIHVKSGGNIGADQRRRVHADEWPAWLVEYLHTQTGMKLDHDATIYVHPETFYEGVLLLWRTGAAIGALKYITTGNAKDKSQSIWLRAVYETPHTGPYKSLSGLADTLSAQLQYDTLIQLMVLQDLFAINGATLKIQNNKQSGEQALAVCLPAVPVQLPSEDDTDDLFTSVLEQVPVSTDEGERESFFTQVIRELNGEDTMPIAIVDDSSGPADSGESETLVVPPPSLRERLAALDPLESEIPEEDQDRQANARYASGQFGPDNHKQPDTLIVPPPGFRERMAALTKNGGEIEVIEPDNESEKHIVPPPGMHRRIRDRRAKRDAEPAEPEDSTPPDINEPRAGEDPSRETGER